MFQSDASVEDADLDSLALGLFPEGRNTEQFEPPIDRLSGGEQDLVDLEGGKTVEGWASQIEFNLRRIEK